MKNDAFRESLAFVSVYDVLRNNTPKEKFHESIPYAIDESISYIGKIIDTFDSIKKDKPIYFPVSAIHGVARHYGCFPLKDGEQIDYINYNLENAWHQLHDLKENPEELYSRKDSELCNLIFDIKSIVDEEVRVELEISRREMNNDD